MSADIRKEIVATARRRSSRAVDAAAARDGRTPALSAVFVLLPVSAVVRMHGAVQGRRRAIAVGPPPPEPTEEGKGATVARTMTAGIPLWSS